MREEYDFSQRERGRFFRQGAVPSIPVYLDEENRVFVEEIARRKESDVSTVVNELLRSERAALKAAE
jgi:hypothetical protein